jgi:molybdopterin converting factor small subunit
MGNEIIPGMITVKVFADLRQFHQPETVLPVDGTASISSIIQTLLIPPSKISIIFVNGRHASLQDLVSPGDVLSLFPPVGGG